MSASVTNRMITHERLVHRWFQPARIYVSFWQVLSMYRNRIGPNGHFIFSKMMQIMHKIAPVPVTFQVASKVSLDTGFKHWRTRGWRQNVFGKWFVTICKFCVPGTYHVKPVGSRLDSKTKGTRRSLWCTRSPTLESLHSPAPPPWRATHWLQFS